MGGERVLTGRKAKGRGGSTARLGRELQSRRWRRVGVPENDREAIIFQRELHSIIGGLSPAINATSKQWILCSAFLAVTEIWGYGPQVLFYEWD